MTIDEAIKHCEEVAWENDKKAMCVEEAYQTTEQQNCEQCAADHRQLAEWLRELKELRCLKSDYDIFRAEAKRLLRLAVEDFAKMDYHIFDCDRSCNDGCPLSGERDHCLKWRYYDEAEKLLKTEG